MKHWNILMSQNDNWKNWSTVSAKQPRIARTKSEKKGKYAILYTHCHAILYILMRKLLKRSYFKSLRNTFETKGHQQFGLDAFMFEKSL